MEYLNQVLRFARYKYDFTETNGSIYVVKKEGLLDSGEAINIKINKGDNIQKDNLYIYIDGDNKYFIYWTINYLSMYNEFYLFVSLYLITNSAASL